MTKKSPISQLTSRRDPANYLAEITPADYDGYPFGSTTFAETRAVFVGTGGDLNVYPARNAAQGDWTPILLKNVQSGVLLPIAVVGVASTSTTATDLVGCY